MLYVWFVWQRPYTQRFGITFIKLRKLLNEEDIDIEFEYVAELDEEYINDMGDSNSYKSKSPFGRYFNSVLIKC